MKKIIYTIIISLLFIPIFVFAGNKDVDMYLFYGRGCPHCAQLEEFLDKYLPKNTDVKLHKYEVWYDSDNANKLKEVQKILKDNSSGVPYLVIGNDSIVGYIEDYTDELIKNTITYYREVNYNDKVGIYLGVKEGTYDINSTSSDTNNTNETNETNSTDVAKYNKGDKINVPDYLKGIVKDSSLFVSAMVIGFIDGLNPCAMWILLFLISMLLSVRNKKKRYLIGASFIFASAAVYFLFLISWINLATFLNKITYIRLSIAFISIVLGGYSIVRFINSIGKDGCEVVNTKNRRRIIAAIKKIVKEKSIFIAILGVMALAAAVNVIELLCSLGLPVMFTQLLVINNVSNTWKIIYSFVYVFFFLVDDIIIFVIAMKTLEIKAISNKVGKYAHLVGGLLMLAIGLLMMFKPEWLMFNFR